MNRRATKTLLMEGAWKLKFFCLKNVSTGSRAEQSGATQSSRIDGRTKAKAPVVGQFFDFFEKR